MRRERREREHERGEREMREERERERGERERVYLSIYLSISQSACPTLLT
jgi:hypothetical protein